MIDQSSQFSRSNKKMLTRSALSISFALIVTSSRRETTSPEEAMLLHSSKTARSFSLDVASENKARVESVVSSSIGPSVAYRGKYCQRCALIDNAVDGLVTSRINFVKSISTECSINSRKLLPVGFKLCPLKALIEASRRHEKNVAVDWLCFAVTLAWTQIMYRTPVLACRLH